MKIFYSWQSDIDNKFNRGFIKNALEKTIVKLNLHLSIDDAERQVKLDHDTKGITGMPDLAGTIFDKIKDSTLFIADITYVADNQNRKLPNPNVLIELGFALAVLGSDKVFCVLNTAYGSTEDLPFDLKHKRHPIQYYLNEGSADKSVQKKQFEDTLLSAIKPIIDLEKYSEKTLQLPANPSREDIFKVIMASDSRDDWVRNEIEHLSKGCTYYRKNVNLRFEIDYTENGTHREDFKEIWANKHPDPSASSYWCTLFYGATIIETFIFVYVDGSRAMLPLPTSCIDLTVKPLYYKIAKIHDPSSKVEEYMIRSGLKLKNVDLESGFDDGTGWGGGSGDGAGRADGSG